tara:strand:+ start:649 stop:792 length:144 start_codon:yes stop_codon:yes gene_type:complete
MNESLLNLQKKFFSRYKTYSRQKGLAAEIKAKAYKRAWLDVNKELRL